MIADVHTRRSDVTPPYSSRLPGPGVGVGVRVEPPSFSQSFSAARCRRAGPTRATTEGSSRGLDAWSTRLSSTPVPLGIFVLMKLPRVRFLEWLRAKLPAMARVVHCVDETIVAKPSKTNL
jgi:hypothetical protein